MARCVYCNQPAFTGGWVKPELCEAHFELAVIRAHLAREHQHFGPNTVLLTMRAKEREGVKFSFTAERMPELIVQMITEDTVYIPALPAPELA